MTALELLNWMSDRLKDHRVENPRLNAELLLACGLNLSREELYVHLRDEVGEEKRDPLLHLLERRISGEPLQYILGKQEFWSIDFRVDPRVLIPRPETELLVEQALALLKSMPSDKASFVLEVGTGSGAVAVSLAREKKDLFVVASDISMGALGLAKENAREAGVETRIAFVQADLFDSFKCGEGREPFALILSNPPYIAGFQLERLAPEVKDHEPVLALAGGADGLDFYRAIVRHAPACLQRGGWLLLEMGQDQAQPIFRLIEGEGRFSKPESLRDLSGIERVVKVQRK